MYLQLLDKSKKQNLYIPIHRYELTKYDTRVATSFNLTQSYAGKPTGVQLNNTHSTVVSVAWTETMEGGHVE